MKLHRTIQVEGQEGRGGINSLKRMREDGNFLASFIYYYYYYYYYY